MAVFAFQLLGLRSSGSGQGNKTAPLIKNNVQNYFRVSRNLKHDCLAFVWIIVVSGALEHSRTGFYIFLARQSCHMQTHSVRPLHSGPNQAFAGLDDILKMGWVTLQPLTALWEFLSSALLHGTTTHHRWVGGHFFILGFSISGGSRLLNIIIESKQSFTGSGELHSKIPSPSK